LQIATLQLTKNRRRIERGLKCAAKKLGHVKTRKEPVGLRASVSDVGFSRLRAFGASTSEGSLPPQTLLDQPEDRTSNLPLTSAWLMNQSQEQKEQH